MRAPSPHLPTAARAVGRSRNGSTSVIREAAMADEQDNDAPDQEDTDLGISDEDAERLLADAVEEDSSDSGDQDGDDEDDGQLRAAGRRALEAMKEQRKAARTERDKARQELEAARRELDKFKNANKSELQRLIDERDALKEQLSTVSST